MPSAFSQQLIAQAGPVDGYLHIDPQPVEVATTLDKEFKSVNRYELWTHKQTADLLVYHPVAVWRQLSVTTDTLNTPYNAGVRPVFYYAFTEVELTDKAPKSMRALLLFQGHYDVYGRY